MMHFPREAASTTVQNLDLINPTEADRFEYLGFEMFKDEGFTKFFQEQVGMPVIASYTSKDRLGVDDEDYTTTAQQNYIGLGSCALSIIFLSNGKKMVIRGACVLQVR